MDAGAHKLLESATQRTLHAHAFSRSSSQASAVLTDLLSRYLALLTSTCAKYAQHAGRRSLSVYDAMGVLDELGVSLEELSEYCTTEGKELNRYAHSSARRVEDLNEFRSQLNEGLRQDRDDAIPLEYARVPSERFNEEEEEEESDDEGETSNMLGVEFTSRKRPASPSRPSTPPLPLSPISNPSSPRKRPRITNWEPPEHIPDFLPPFPTLSGDTPEELAPHPIPQPHTSHLMMPPPPSVKVEKAPISLLQQPVTTSAASDILVQVPYSQSTLSAVPEWHLPAPPPPPTTQNRQVRLATPQVDHALLTAYHHILTTRPPQAPPALNPSRHKVAMALMHDWQTNPKFTPSDSLFATVSPTPPRVATIGPTYPIPIGETPGLDEKGKDGKDKETKLPPMPPRPVVEGNGRIAPFVSQQTSRIPDLARLVLPSGIFARTTRLSHPPALFRGSQPVVKWNSAIPAPWNTNPLPSGPDVVPSTPQTAKPKDGPQTNGKDTASKSALPDAKLYATWEYETKDFAKPLPSHTRPRTRVGSMAAGPSSAISLTVNSRSKGIK